MIRSDGKCKINGLGVGEVTISLLGPLPVLSAKYVFINTESGDRFGAGNRNQNWSKETLDHLEALVHSMERDLRGDVFEAEATTGGVVEDDNTQGDVPLGL